MGPQAQVVSSQGHRHDAIELGLSRDDKRGHAHLSQFALQTVLLE